MEIQITSKGDVVAMMSDGTAVQTNDVVAKIMFADATSNIVLTADRISVNTNTAIIEADGSVRMQEGDLTLTGPSFRFDYQTRQMDWGNFRIGEQPYYARGTGLHANITNRLFTATNAEVTTDDYSHPFQKVHASELTIVPGKYMEAYNAVAYVGGVPVFYFPYYHQDLTGNPNHFSFVVGDRGTYGPYLLSSYYWTLNDELNGVLHGDWRQKRGFGVGPDVNYNLGRLGEGTARYYYAHDEEPGTDPVTGAPLPENRQRAYFTYNASPFTNFNLMSQVAYLSDPFVTRDFFESQYTKDVQPNTFFDANKLWPNWSLDLLAQPRVNHFYETIERLPEARLTGFRQQILDTPFYYESETSAGYYQRMFADTNSLGTNFYGARADTFHQITLPRTFFGWLNVTPRAGGRFTYYNEASGPGATTTNQDRTVFNTGAEVSFKTSRLWQGAESKFWEVEGLRHILEPSLNYVYIPKPSVPPSELPQFDYELTNSLRLLPLDFPDYNSIDSIDSQNTIRFGVNNRLQTKRDGQLTDLVNWEVFTDWHLRPRTNQTTFSDVYSDLQLKPRNWLTFSSQLRYDIKTARFNMAQDSITFQPNNTWSWSVGQFFLRDNTVIGPGNDLFTSTFFYRFSENWGARMSHYYDAKTGTLAEQDYSLYRDLRSWTAALTFRALDNQSNGHEYGVAVTFSFKAFPRFGLGSDTVSASSLLGY